MPVGEPLAPDAREAPEPVAPEAPAEPDAEAAGLV